MNKNTCLKCEHSVWAVGIGQGFFCRHKKNIPEGKWKMMIPNRQHSCEHFEEKIKVKL